jgi:transcriptional regulator with XRE-family HTH domain
MKLLNIHELKEKHGLTGARIGLLAGVAPRTVRQWLEPESNLRYVHIPHSALWLLHLLLGEATPEEIILLAESREKKKPGKKPSTDPDGDHDV